MSDENMVELARANADTKLTRPGDNQAPRPELEVRSGGPTTSGRVEYPGSAFVRTHAGYLGLCFVETLFDREAVLVGNRLPPVAARLSLFVQMADGRAFSADAVALENEDHGSDERTCRVRFEQLSR